MCRYYLLSILFTDIIYCLFFFRRRRVITYEMTYFNSEYTCDKEVPKASCIFVLWTVNICD